MKISRNDARLKRKIRIRKKLSGSSSRPRLVVFRSNKHIYAQLVDDLAGATLASASSKALGLEKVHLTVDVSTMVGKKLAEAALAKNITAVVFDRNGFIYHGRVKALADGAREAGLKF